MFKLECGLLQVHYGDGLPECICSECHDQLVVTNKFRKQCHASTDYLNKIRLAYEEERNFSIKLEVIPLDDNVSSSGEDMFNVSGYTSSVIDDSRKINS